jgi:glycolate oxidase FAD binding subunit
MQNIIDQFAGTIRTAAERKAPLRICGGGSKEFYGNPIIGQNISMLDVTAYSGIVAYEPTELVVTARTGTHLADLEAELYEHRQMLAFEPPHFGAAATLGGCVAAGLSGPRRASVGAVRDFVLGVRMLDGRGDDLRFGGQVMKNVAGYDISRLMTGSMGTLGLLLEISLKVLPLPPTEMTLSLQMKEAEAIEKMNRWVGKPLPISATCFCNDMLTLRLSGAEAAVHAAHMKLGGEEVAEAAAFWQSVREQTHLFFQPGKSLWRLSMKSTTPPLSLPGQQLIEWGGALRWLISDAAMDAGTVRAAAKTAGGHATLFRSNEVFADAFHPLVPEMMNIHRRLKEKFDPVGILNPGRMYPGL